MSTTLHQMPPPLPRGAEAERHNRGHRIPVRGRYQTELVYNGAHMQRSVQFSGDIYDIPPFGTAEIHPHGSPQKDEESGKIISGPWVIQMSSHEIVDELCKDECEGRAGLVHIPRDATDDEIARLKDQAKNTWFEYFATMSEDGISDWEGFVTRFREARPGDLPPRRPMRINAFYNFRRLRRSSALGRKQFVCMYCGGEFDKEAERLEHIEFDHPNAPEIREALAPGGPPAESPRAESLDQFLAGQDKDEAPGPKARSSPPPATKNEPLTDAEKQNRERGRQLFQEATRRVVSLSVADAKGLRFGDPEVLQDVESRVAAAGRLVKPSPEKKVKVK